MLIEKKKTAELLPAEYNPRKDLKPGDEEYEKLNEEITSQGYSHKEVVDFKTYYESKMREIKKASIDLSRELHLADELMDEYNAPVVKPSKEPEKDKILSTRQSR